MALVGLHRDRVGSRYSVDAFRAAGINSGGVLSPTPWPDGFVEAERRALLSVYDELVAFYESAASREQAVLKYLD